MALAEVWASRLAGDGERFRAAQARVLAAEKAVGAAVPTVPESDALDHIPTDHLHGTVVPKSCIASVQAVFGIRYRYEKRPDDSAMVFVVPLDLTRQEFEDGWARLMCHEVVLRTVIVEYDDKATAELYMNFFVMAVTRVESDFRREIIIASKSPEPHVPFSDGELSAEVETAGDEVRRLAVALAEHTDATVFDSYLKLSEMAATTFAMRFAAAHGIPTEDIRAFMKAFRKHVHKIATEDTADDLFIGAGMLRMFESFSLRQKAWMYLLSMLAYMLLGLVLGVGSESGCGEIGKAADIARIVAEGGVFGSVPRNIYTRLARPVKAAAGVGAFGAAAFSNMFGVGVSAEYDQSWSLVQDLTTFLADKPQQCVDIQLAMRTASITASSGLGLLIAAKRIGIALGITSILELVLMFVVGRRSTLLSVDPLAVPRVTRAEHGKDEDLSARPVFMAHCPENMAGMTPVAVAVATPNSGDLAAMADIFARCEPGETFAIPDDATFVMVKTGTAVVAFLMLQDMDAFKDKPNFVQAGGLAGRKGSLVTSMCKDPLASVTGTATLMLDVAMGGGDYLLAHASVDKEFLGKVYTRAGFKNVGVLDKSAGLYDVDTIIYRKLDDIDSGGAAAGDNHLAGVATLGAKPADDHDIKLVYPAADTEAHHALSLPSWAINYNSSSREGNEGVFAMLNHDDVRKKIVNSKAPGSTEMLARFDRGAADAHDAMRKAMDTFLDAAADGYVPADPDEFNTVIQQLLKASRLGTLSGMLLSAAVSVADSERLARRTMELEVTLRAFWNSDDVEEANIDESLRMKTFADFVRVHVMPSATLIRDMGPRLSAVYPDQFGISEGAASQLSQYMHDATDWLTVSARQLGRFYELATHSVSEGMVRVAANTILYIGRSRRITTVANIKRRDGKPIYYAIDPTTALAYTSPYRRTLAETGALWCANVGSIVTLVVKNDLLLPDMSNPATIARIHAQMLAGTIEDRRAAVSLDRAFPVVMSEGTGKLVVKRDSSSGNDDAIVKWMCEVGGYRGYIAPAFGIFPSEIVSCELEEIVHIGKIYHASDLNPWLCKRPDARLWYKRWD